ncbi:helix-turn-helix transcriptional regulator [Candidatus Roizmanbacteria bacterium]|nr:helix-turn-helix transcriptional regulator [Candidatus Roizmanbacteria bacterium]
MRYLAEELQKFYRKSGNKLLFTNGMSLNQLALEMWEYLGEEGMDSSLLSKIINGKRLLTRNQLDAFCKVLHLNKLEIYDIQNALGKDLLFKYVGEAIPISNYGDVVADPYIKKMIPREMKRLREKGNIREAMKIVSFFEQILNFTPKVKNANLDLLARILDEKVRCFIYTERPEDLLPKVERINSFTIYIGLKMNDPDIISMSHANIGGSFYVAKKLRDSAEYLEKTLPLVDGATKVEYVRTLLNDYAFLGDYHQYKKTYFKAEKILSEKEKHNKSHIASMHEAISRSLALIGETDLASKQLDEVDKSGVETFFKSEIVRGKMFVCHQAFRQKKKIDIDKVRDLFRQSRHQRFLLFKRHQSQITKMYQEICGRNVK